MTIRVWPFKWLVLGGKIIKKLAELAKEEGVVLDYYIDPDDEIIEITKYIIRRAKND